MDSSADIRQFLATRRARISPEQAGLTRYGRRRVPGLRREEVAMLAGVSADYYARLERGNLSGVSDSVLDAIARALQLDDDESAHLRYLAAAANTPRLRRRSRGPSQIRPAVQRILDGMADVPAFVRNGRLDILGANRLGYALYALVFEDPDRPANIARFAFLDARSHEFYENWDDAANTCVALLRAEAGRDPYNKDLSDLVGELSTRSEIFRRRWASHNVRILRSGVKGFRHPSVGELTLSFEIMELAADTGLYMTAYTAEPDSPSADGLKLLASWAATPDHVRPAEMNKTAEQPNS